MAEDTVMDFVGVVVALGALLTLGIGLVWLVPFWMLSIAVLYVRMFGYGGPAPA